MNNDNFNKIQLALNYAVNDYLKANNMYQTDFAKQIGKTDSMVTYTMSGRQNFTIAALIEIGKAMGKEVRVDFIEPKPKDNTGLDLLTAVQLKRLGVNTDSLKPLALPSISEQDNIGKQHYPKSILRVDAFRLGMQNLIKILLRDCN